MIELPITVKNRISLYTGEKKILCGNSDYELVFTFDEEWAADSCKTALLWYTAEDGTRTLHPILFRGERCPVPLIPDAVKILVGVSTANLKTTSNAEIACERTSYCPSCLQPAPPDDLYNQIIAMLNGFSGDGRPLAPATRSSLGGVMVGDGLSVDESGKISVDVVKTAEAESQKPITAGAVWSILGNIQTLLSQI